MKQHVTRTNRLAEIDRLAARLTAWWERPVGRRQALDAAVLQFLRQLEADMPPYSGLQDETDFPTVQKETA